MKTDNPENSISSAVPSGSPADAQMKEEKVLHGIPASPGIAIGSILLVDGCDKPLLSAGERGIREEDVPTECRRFENAIVKTREEIVELKKKVEDSLPENEASIFDAHLLLVDDKMLMKEVLDAIRTRLLSAESVFTETIQRYISAISAVNDQYLKERAADVSDVASRVLGHLSGTGKPMLEHMPGLRIIISHELAPSDTATLDRENVQAFATETGSRTSHTAILARSMKIPSVLGIPGLLGQVRSGQMAVVDGFLGDVILNPSQATLEEYAKREEEEERLYNELLQESSLTPETLDGYRISLSANLDDSADAGKLKEYGISGIGLFRTEYLFMSADRIPTEEEQLAVYRKTVEAVEGRSTTIRTLDLGGDKISSLINIAREPNPFLGLRSVRLCLEFPQLIIPQLRAILRASAFGKVRMMFPMITCEDELDRMLELTERVRTDLRGEKVKFDEHMPVGVMIETPAAALWADRLAEKCDFFSIGTNDLVQYTMAVDRGNERVANLYRPAHPVILNLIGATVRAARKAGISVSVCGEMAADAHFIPLLMGLGVQELSMNARSLGMVRRVIRRLRIYEAEALADQALKCSSHTEVLALSEKLLKKILPDMLNFSIKGA